MNDYLDLFSDKDSAIFAIKVVICILSTVRFCLHKWIANDREILRSLPVSQVSFKIVNLELDSLNNILPIKAVKKTSPT